MQFLHSIGEYSSLIEGCLKLAHARELVEVGQAQNGVAQQLAGYLRKYDARITVIDRAPSTAFIEWQQRHAQVLLEQGRSLDLLGLQNDVDAWILSGEHNYHHVFNELRIASHLAERDDRPLLAFVHHVGWPCGRRDHYADLGSVPDYARHAVAQDVSGIPPAIYLRGDENAGFAAHQGGGANGVLTAVEDFMRDSFDLGRDLAYAQVPAIFGLGIIYDNAARYARVLAEYLRPWDRNPLLIRMEEDRLRQIGAEFSAT